MYKLHDDRLTNVNVGDVGGILKIVPMSRNNQSPLSRDFELNQIRRQFQLPDSIIIPKQTQEYSHMKLMDSVTSLASLGNETSPIKHPTNIATKIDMNIHMLTSMDSSRGQASKRAENSITTSRFANTKDPREARDQRQDRSRSSIVDNNTAQVRIVVTQRNNHGRNLSVAGHRASPELAQLPERGRSQLENPNQDLCIVNSRNYL